MPIFKGSRYTKTPAYIKSGDNLVLAIRDRFRFNLSDAVIYTVIQGDTIDGIAFKHYKDAQYYWAILDANPSFPTALSIKPGDVLVIPSLEEVVKSLE